MHYVQKHILNILTHTEWARFRDMKPPRVDSNAYSYHLKSLIKLDLVEKTEEGYKLTPHGLSYVDRVSLEKFEPRLQPKIITMLVIRNEDGEVLMWRKKKQPFIGAWSLPHGKLHLQDESVQAAVERESRERIGRTLQDVQRRGICSIRVHMNSELVSAVMAHIYEASLLKNTKLPEDIVWSWVSPKRIETLDKRAPATSEIVACALHAPSPFFEEFTIEWQ